MGWMGEAWKGDMSKSLDRSGEAGRRAGAAGPEAGLDGRVTRPQWHGSCVPISVVFFVPIGQRDAVRPAAAGAGALDQREKKNRKGVARRFRPMAKEAFISFHCGACAAV